MDKPTIYELQQTVNVVPEYGSYEMPVIWHAGTLICRDSEIEALIRSVWVEALTKVAMDWQAKMKDWGKNNDVGIIEVQAFLDSRHVHYPECWAPSHPQYTSRNDKKFQVLG